MRFKTLATKRKKAPLTSSGCPNDEQRSDHVLTLRQKSAPNAAVSTVVPWQPLPAQRAPTMMK